MRVEYEVACIDMHRERNLLLSEVEVGRAVICSSICSKETNADTSILQSSLWVVVACVVLYGLP
jgi:hypothetical protein